MGGVTTLNTACRSWQFVPVNIWANVLWVHHTVCVSHYCTQRGQTVTVTDCHHTSVCWYHRCHQLPPVVTRSLGRCGRVRSAVSTVDHVLQHDLGVEFHQYQYWHWPMLTSQHRSKTTNQSYSNRNQFFQSVNYQSTTWLTHAFTHSFISGMHH